MNLRLDGKTALVTGAANGLGRATALHLAELGANIAVIDLDAEGLENLHSELKDRGTNAVTYWGNCVDKNDINTFVSAVRDGFDSVDILVNNVGQSAREKATHFVESTEETWQFVLEVSLLSAMRFTREIAPTMKQQGFGRIINISSDAALVGDAGLADYSTAKSGLLGFTRSVARELAPHKVTVNAVCYGTVRTLAHDRMDKQMIEKMKQQVPAGYIAEPDDVVPIIGFLAGQGASYITGQTIAVNGGRWFV